MSLLSDREIEELVTRVFSSDSRIDPGEIDVQVQKGVVYLCGAVDSAAERRAAEEAAQSVPAVDGVVDKLGLRNFVERTDDELADTVRRALVRDIVVDAGPVCVEAREGMVTLGGRVSSYRQKSAAENIAWWTAGVTDVVSNIEVDGIREPPDEPDY